MSLWNQVVSFEKHQTIEKYCNRRTIKYHHIPDVRIFCDFDLFQDDFSTIKKCLDLLFDTNVKWEGTFDVETEIANYPLLDIGFFKKLLCGPSKKALANIRRVKEDEVQYDAYTLSLILEISRTPTIIRKEKSKHIYLTQHDIFVDRDNFDFGISYVMGNVVVVSKYRLENLYNLLKIIIHEFGHTLGIDHCKVDNRCVFGGMMDGEDMLQKSIIPCEECLQKIAYVTDRSIDEVSKSVQDILSTKFC